MNLYHLYGCWGGPFNTELPKPEVYYTSKGRRQRSIMRRESIWFPSNYSVILSWPFETCLFWLVRTIQIFIFISTFLLSFNLHKLNCVSAGLSISLNKCTPCPFVLLWLSIIFMSYSCNKTGRLFLTLQSQMECNYHQPLAGMATVYSRKCHFKVFRALVQIPLELDHKENWAIFH